MATAEKGFHIPSEEEIDKLLTDKDSINTQKATTSEHSTNGIYQSHYLQEMKQNDINIFFL
jgi:DNA polymerase I-like protein with 3'-5' exonuclease and polymerase domains